MASQGGIKHAATEPSHLDTRRDVRRRGAEGRAAVLRRAPSDSDCSGETASLSADSAERLRPVLPPPRANKTRSLPNSRRRGSEWEVLEGLKDGQRFERRPEVYNGYLHKKRKWPLKGWHKRFFVVDGGILVYARSPADVARGRLHGSVDVGLSVISAKARRRRMDIDADEFIYHLRAKTADVFRTWLNVLKVHRLYRQHLLTFGARESVPKIHAPLDDLPPTDTSSRTSSSSLLTLSSESSKQALRSIKKPDEIAPVFSQNIACYIQSPVYYNPGQNPINTWLINGLDDTECNSEVMPLNFEPLEEDILDTKPENLYNHSLCSMKCMAKRYETDFEELKERNGSILVSETERQINTTELDKNSLRTKDSSMINYSFNSTTFDKTKDKVIKPVFPVFNEVNESFNITKSNNSTKRSLLFGRKIEPTTALFLFSRKKKIEDPSALESPMKKSKKSTNLVKYRNIHDEPPLKKPLSRSMLLKKYKTKVSKLTGHDEVINKVSDEVQVAIENDNKENKSLQDVMTTSEYDGIAEKLITNIFGAKCSTSKSKTVGNDIQYYVNHMVRELYDVKYTQTEVHPVKVLFRCLLEYWLRNTSTAKIKNALKSVKSVNIQSKNYFTRDKELSSLLIGNVTKQTQFHGFNFSKDIVPKPIEKKRQGNPNRTPTYSFMKERRIQELEKLLKNTVYTCETLCGNKSKEKDIAITKKLIDNLENFPRKSDGSNGTDQTKDNSQSSTEFPEIQDTFNHLLSETAIPPSVAKEFLGAYLDILLNDSNTDSAETSDSSNNSNQMPVCDVQTESVMKRVSKGIITAEKKVTEKVQNKIDLTAGEDPGQKYLKDILEKITTIFSKVKPSCNKSSQDKDVQPDDTKVEGSFKEEIERNKYSGKTLISENKENNSIVLDLTKYDLEHISMFSDPVMRGAMSITIKLKEHPPDFGECKRRNLNLKFSEDTQKTFNRSQHLENLCNDSSTRNYKKSPVDPRTSFKNPYIHFDFNNKEPIELKPCLSQSDATSKAYRVLYDSQNSLDFSVPNKLAENCTDSKKSFDCREDPQSCYILSSVKKSVLSSAFKLKKKIRIKDFNGAPLGSDVPAGKSTSTTTKVIDEEFLLLLLENLTLLSQNVPGLHKEINSLYIRLKKKHERDFRNSFNAGVGLLGKIYNEEPKVTDVETQFDANVFNENPIVIKSRQIDIGLNTSTDLFGLKSQVDRTTSVFLAVSELKTLETQTNDKYATDKKTVDVHTSLSKVLHIEDDLCKPHSILKPSVITIETVEINRYAKLSTKNCGANTVLKCFMDDNSCQNFRFIPEETSARAKNFSNGRHVSTRERTNHDRELWSSVNHNSQEGTQTDKTMKRFLREKKIRKDFNVYQLFVSNKYQPHLSSSLSGSNVEIHSDDMKTIYRCASEPSYCSESGGPLDTASRELGQAQLSVQQLQRLLEALELQHHHHRDTDQVSLEGASPHVKKDRRKFGLRKKKSGTKCASVELAPHHHPDASASHMAISALTAPPSPGGGASSAPNSAASLPIACAAARPQSLPGTEALGGGPASLTSLTPDHQLREDFTVLAKDLVATLKGVVSTLVVERGRLRAAAEAGEGAGGALSALRSNLSSALHQNSELRSRLSRIHDASDLAEISSLNNTDPVNRPFHQSPSYSSSCVSASEFFDAEELVEPRHDLLPADECGQQAGVIELDGDSSSEAGSLSSEEGSVASSDNSDGALLSTEPVTVRLNNGLERSQSGSGWVRRTRLPCPRPTPGGPSLWNLLYKNIGKDLSQVSMPVTINEPLNMLQRLCEELEYSELLDSASSTPGAIERMSLVAAFAVSAYAASAHRAASKPFNPLLAETYECVRSDRGFRFLAEQVSHHPPVSACHAESPRWVVWQEARIKTKFWGKSMEFQPAGRVHVRLLPQGDHYSWNKVTTCVHNLFGGQRWVDQYGDMHVVCHGTDIAAKLNFIKASSWSSSRHEVRGFVTDGSSGTRVRLQGRWSEALYAGEPPAARCLWRPGAMPPEHELYYGFTRFAMELNELEPGLRELLPPTDTRLRPDQRALEEGDVEAAERHKHSLEQAQRDRRRHSADHQPAWFRKSVDEGEEMWVFSGEYWRARGAGFGPAPAIW